MSESVQSSFRVPVQHQDSQGPQHQGLELAAQSFPQVVVPWGASAATDPLLYAGKVQQLPRSFDGGMTSYASSLLWLLAEEVRAQVAQALEQVEEQPVAQVRLELVEERQAGNAPSPAGSEPALVQVQVSPPPDDSNSPAAAKLLRSCRSTDLLLLSNRPVMSYQDLGRQDLLLSLALITQSSESEAGDTTDFQASISGSLYSTLDQQYDHDSGAAKRGCSWYIKPLGNTAAAQRAWVALQGLLQAGLGEPPCVTPLLLQILHGPGLAREPRRAGQQFSQAVQRFCDDWSLNASQARVVLDVTSAVVGAQGSDSGSSSGGSSSIHLVQGPPGTGKTSTTVQALKVLGGSGCSVLVCATTNVAVQEVAGRLLRELGGRQFGGAGAPGAQLPGSCCIKRWSLVLLASKGKVDEDSPLTAIELRARVQRLHQALGLEGWPSCASEFKVQLAKGLIVAYHGKLQKEAAQKLGDVSKAELVVIIKPEEFKAWVLQRLVQLQGALTTVGTTLLEELPDEFQDPTSCGNIRAALRLAEQLRQECAGMEAALLLATLGGVEEEEAEEESSGGSGGGDPEASAMAARLLLVRAELLRALGLPVHHLVPRKQCSSSSSVQRMVLEAASLVFCTVSSAGRHVLKDKDFDACIVDEAGQLVEAETSIILQGWPALKALVLVGDHKQLPGLVISRLAQSKLYGRSMFERLQQIGMKMSLLDTQYRMHPEVSVWPRHEFYGGKVVDGANVLDAVRACALGPGPHIAQLGPFAFIHVEGQEEQELGSTSYHNPVEAGMVAVMVRALQQQYKARQEGQGQGVGQGRGTGQLSIGVISPYSAQVCSIMEKLGIREPQQTGRGAARAVSRPVGATEAAGVAGGSGSGGVVGCRVEVRSVDGFQGREMDVILLSAVRSNKKGAIGFVQDPRRLNVSITRGRHAVWVLGNTTLLQLDEVWGRLVVSARERDCLFDSGSIPELHKVVKQNQLMMKRQALIAQPGSSLFDGTLWEVVFCKDFQSSLVELGTRALLQTYRVPEWQDTGFIQPSAFITLLERQCSLAICCIKHLHGAALPVSYITLHLAAPGPSALLTLLLRQGCSPSAKEALTQALSAVSALLAGLLCDPEGLQGWAAATARNQENEEVKDQVGSFTTRAFLLLFVLSMNEKPVPAAGHRHGGQASGGAASRELIRAARALGGSGAGASAGRRQLQHVKEAAGGKGEARLQLPAPLQLLATRMSAEVQCDTRPRELLIRLQPAMTSLGDSFLFLRRPATYESSISWLRGVQGIEVESREPQEPAAGSDPSGPASATHAVFSLSALRSQVKGAVPQQQQHDGGSGAKSPGKQGESAAAAEGVRKEEEGQLDIAAEEGGGQGGEGGAEAGAAGEDVLMPMALAQLQAASCPVAELLRLHPWVCEGLRRWMAGTLRFTRGKLSLVERLQRAAMLVFRGPMRLVQEEDGAQVMRKYLKCFVTRLCPEQAAAMELAPKVYEFWQRCIKEDREDLEEQGELAYQLNETIRALLPMADPSYEQHRSYDLEWLELELVGALQAAVHQVHDRLASFLEAVEGGASGGLVQGSQTEKGGGGSCAQSKQQHSASRKKKKGKGRR